MNDISVHRKPGFRVADLAYALAGEEIGRVRCDGLVVSTPQGSTGYNLANGGPVLAWGVAGFVVSFIAPHSLTARSLVVAPDDLLTINNRSRDEPVEIHVDGRPVVELKRGRGHPRRVRARDGDAGPAAGRELLPPPARALRPARALSTSRPARARSRRADFVTELAPTSCRFVRVRPLRRPIRRGRLVDPARAGRAARREPPADRAGRAAARRRAQRADGRDRGGEDRARARARPAARRQAARRDRPPGRVGGVRRGQLRAAATSCAPSSASGSPTTPRSWCSRGASAPRAARARTSAAAARRRATCATSAARCSRSTASTSTAS